MAASAIVFRDTLISVIPAGVRHQHEVVADGGVIRGSLISVILVGVPLMSRKWCCSRRQSPTTASYPLFRQAFASRRGYYVQPGDWGHSPQRYIPHSSFCFCDIQEITSLQTTDARSYSKCVAASVRYAGTWTGSMCLQFRTSSDGKWLRNCNYKNNV